MDPIGMGQHTPENRPCRWGSGIPPAHPGSKETAAVLDGTAAAILWIDFQQT